MATSTCSVRFFNELPEGASVTGLGDGLSLIAPSLVPTSYAAATCGSPLRIALPRTQPFNVTVPPASGTSHHSVLLYNDALGQLKTSVFDDIDVGYTDDPNGGKIDQCQVTVISALPSPVGLYGGPSECYNCALPLLSDKGAGVPPGGSFSMDVQAIYDHYNVRAWGAKTSAGWPATVRSDSVAGAAWATIALPMTTLKEHGVYTLLLHPDGTSTLLEDVAGRNAYLPIFYTFLILAALGVAHWALGRAYATYYSASGAAGAPPAPKKGEVTLATFLGYHKVLAKALKAQEEGGEPASLSIKGLQEGLLGEEGRAEVMGSLQQEEAAAAPKSKGGKPERVLSLDTFRGFALCLMMFANFGGARYWFFDHARWNGLTVADLLFPWFVFMSGVSAALSFASERRKGATALGLAVKSLMRCLKLLALGLLFVNSPTYLPGIRAFSVLSYFAVSYLFIGLVDALIPVQEEGGEPQGLAGALWQDFGRYGLQWGAFLCIGGVYMLVRFFLPVPGCPTGYAGPAGLADQGAYPDTCVGGAAGYLSVQLFGQAHSYGGATCGEVYKCAAYDPEGALGGLMAAWMAWLGLSAGRMLEAQRAAAAAQGGRGMAYLAPRITMRWVTMGLILCLLAGILCGCECFLLLLFALCAAHFVCHVRLLTPPPHGTYIYFLWDFTCAQSKRREALSPLIKTCGAPPSFCSLRALDTSILPSCSTLWM